jgi:hypothetical protein
MLSTRIALAFLLLLASEATASAQSTWFVDVSGAPPGNGTPGNPYTSIQYAHDQAATLSGDTLSIAPGVYGEALYFSQGKALRLVGAGIDATFLDGGLDVISVPGTTRIENLTFRDEEVAFDQSDASIERVRVEAIDDPAETAVTVTLADSTWVDVEFRDNHAGLLVVGDITATLTRVGLYNSGGGPLLWGQGATLALSDCVVAGSYLISGSGAGLRLENCTTTVQGSWIEGNTALQGVEAQHGGAILQEGGTLTIDDCMFDGNASARGGALALLGSAVATVRDTMFLENRARGHGLSRDWKSQGGAIWIGPQARLDADGCTFTSNSAQEPEFVLTWAEEERGGAIFGGSATSTVRNSMFGNNWAGQGGAALHSAATLIACRIVGNSATGSGSVVHFAHLDRCTLVSNQATAGGVTVLDGSVANSILWANSGAELGGSSWAVYSCIEGGAPGAGNIADDPQFTNLALNDVTLALGSPCIDGASPSAPLDPDLTPADMGALPFTWQPIGASYCSTNPNSSGQTAQIAALGSASVGDDFLRVQAIHTAVDQVGLFIMSQNQGFVPFFNGSQGNLCVSAPIFRLTNTPGSVSSSGAQGLLNLRVGLTTLPAGLAILPGQTWHFQSWFRDSVGGQSTSNTSDAVSVTFQ